jgi:hypothetical protein
MPPQIYGPLLRGEGFSYLYENIYFSGFAPEGERKKNTRSSIWGDPEFLDPQLQVSNPE